MITDVLIICTKQFKEILKVYINGYRLYYNEHKILEKNWVILFWILGFDFWDYFLLFFYFI